MQVSENKEAAFTEKLQLIKRKLLEMESRMVMMQGLNANLQVENERLRQGLEEQKNKLKTIEDKNKMIKLAESIPDESVDKHGLKLEINHYIREIDRCIANLSD